MGVTREGVRVGTETVSYYTTRENVDDMVE